MNYTPRHVLVTGGAGFIGANFIHYMLQIDPTIHITNLDKLTYAADLNNLEAVQASSRYAFIKGDVCDQVQVEKILRERNIETIVHFAAESHVDRSILNPKTFIETNVMGTYALLEAARVVFMQEKKWDSTHCRFHHVSTDEVYGSLNASDPAFTETTPYAPNSPYSSSKASSDHLVRAYQHTYGLPTTVSNCSNNYGPYQHQEKLIPTIINACIHAKRIPVYSDGANVRDWLYVTDHCAAIHLILRRGQVGETYNVGGNEERKNIEIVKLICALTAAKIQCDVQDLLNLIEFVKDRPGHDFRYAINAEKLQQSLGWQLMFNLEQGLKATVAWYFNHIKLKTLQGA